jgi:hypothetical protein
MEINADTRRTSRSGDCSILGSVNVIRPFLHLNATAKGATALLAKVPQSGGPGGPLVDLCPPAGRHCRRGRRVGCWHRHDSDHSCCASRLWTLSPGRRPSPSLLNDVRFCDRGSALWGMQQARYKTRVACHFVVELPAEIEPATPSLPSMRGWFTTPCGIPRHHATALVRAAAEGCVVGRGEVARGVVSGKFLARPGVGGMPRHLGGIVPTRPRRGATGTPGALLSSDDYGSSVERAAKLHPL